jgi:hypothetical protein
MIDRERTPGRPAAPPISLRRALRLSPAAFFSLCVSVCIPEERRKFMAVERERGTSGWPICPLEGLRA